MNFRLPLLCLFLSIFLQTTGKAHTETVNNLPVAQDDFYTIEQGSILETPSANPPHPSILDNDYDSSGGQISLSITMPDTMVSNVNVENTLILFPNGNFRYLPASNYAGTDSFEYEICNDGTPPLCDIGIIYITVEPCIDLQLSVFLEGCYDAQSGEMDNFLNLADGDILYRGVLPGQEPVNVALPGIDPTPLGQPYGIFPWSYNGSEGTFDALPWIDVPESTETYAVYHPDVVDWVLVRFRTGTPSNQMATVETAAALLLKDGTIQFLEPCILSQQEAASNDIYVQIDHRNHMAIMASTPANTTSGVLEVDFTSEQSYAAVSSGQKEITPGIYVMYAGDCDQAGDSPSYDISALDEILWSTQNGSFDAYLQADFDLNGDVTGTDKLLWSTNNGTFSQVPK